MSALYDPERKYAQSARLRCRYGPDIDAHYAIVHFNADIAAIQAEANIDIIVHKRTFKVGQRIHHVFTDAVFKLIDAVVAAVVPYLTQWASSSRLWIPNLWNPYVVPEVCRLEGPCSIWPDRNYTTVLVSLSPSVLTVEIQHRGHKPIDSIQWHPSSILILNNVGMMVIGNGNVKLVCVTYMVDRVAQPISEEATNAAGVTLVPAPVQLVPPSGGIHDSPSIAPPLTRQLPFPHTEQSRPDHPLVTGPHHVEGQPLPAAQPVPAAQSPLTQKSPESNLRTGPPPYTGQSDPERPPFIDQLPYADPYTPPGRPLTRGSPYIEPLPPIRHHADPRSEPPPYTGQLPDAGQPPHPVQPPSTEKNPYISPYSNPYTGQPSATGQRPYPSPYAAPPPYTGPPPGYAP